MISFNVFYAVCFEILLVTRYHEIAGAECFSHYTSITALVTDLKWKSMAVIYDTSRSEEIQIPPAMKQQWYNLQSTDISTVLRQLYSTTRSINIIVAVREHELLRVIKLMDNYDTYSNRTTDYRHHSKILILARALPKVPIHHLENIAVVKEERENGFTIYPLFIHPDGRKFQKLSETSIHSTEQNIFPNIKYGYNNRRLLVTTMEVPPYVNKIVRDGCINFEGYILDIWEAVAKRLNFSYDIIEPDDLDWGKLVNGSWTGVVAQLQNWEVDVGISDLTITYDRAQVVDFLIPVIKADKVDVIYKRLPSTEKSFLLLANPLNQSVYVVLAIVLLGSVLLFTSIDQTRQFPYLPKPRQLLEIVWKFVCLLMRQEYKLIPATKAGQVFLFCWWIVILLVTWVYSANLIAALSSTNDLIRFSSIPELVESNYAVGSYTAGITIDLIKNSPSPAVRSLYNKMLTSNKEDPRTFINDEAVHINRVLNERYAYVMYTSVAEMYLAQDCHLSMMGETLTGGHELLTFAVPKGSPLKNDIEKVMYDLQERGMFELWWTKWIRWNINSTCILKERIVSITMREVLGGFIVVCIGLAICIICLAVEILYKLAQRADKSAEYQS